MIHSPGIYFGMPEDEYFSDESLSKSGISKLLESPEEFWFRSSMNPNPPKDEPSVGIDRGKMWHAKILEPETFGDRYVKAPMIGDIQGLTVLKTKEDMENFLTINGKLYKKSLRKDQLADLIDGMDGVYLFDRENEKFSESNKGKTVIWSEEIWSDMEYAADVINKHPYFCDAFRGGYAEVSIFWIDTETSIPMKARIDYLKPEVIRDYKTLYVRRGLGIDQAALNAIKYEHYDIQAANYVIAVAHAVNMINSGTGIISGEVSGSFIDSFRRTPEKPFQFIFQQEERPNAVRGKTVLRRSDMFNVFGAGLTYMQRGIQIYQSCMEKFGRSRWLDDTGFSEIQDGDIYYNF